MKKTTMKRVVCMLLTAVMLFSLLTGCGAEKKEESSAAPEASSAAPAASSSAAVEAEPEGFQHDPNLSEPGVEPVCTEKVTLTIGLAQNANVENYDTNAFTLMLEETLNVDIEFHLFASAKEAPTQIDMMIQGGGDELPDILMLQLPKDTVHSYAEAEMFIPLDDYYENSAYYLTQKIEEVNEYDGLDILGAIRDYDGHIYSVPGYTGSIGNPLISRMWVYGPWLEELGIEKPKTVEEFKNMLVAFKEKDPNKNGQADEIPVLGSSMDAGYSTRLIAYIMDAYTPMNASTYYLRSYDGVLSASYTQDAFKEGIKTVAEMVKEGLIDPTSFSTDGATWKTIYNAEGDQKFGVLPYQTTSPIAGSHASKKGWTTLFPLEKVDGSETEVSFLANPVQQAAFITKNCENPEAAFRVLDYFYEQNAGVSFRWGVQGENWDWVEDLKQADYPQYNFNGVYAGSTPNIVNYKVVWNQPQNNLWQLTMPALRHTGFTAGVSAATVSPTDTTEESTQIEKYYAAAPKERLGVASFAYSSPEESVELIEQANMLVTYVNEKIAMWASGQADVEADWDAFQKELKAMGFDEWLAAMQAAYDNK